MADPEPSKTSWPPETASEPLDLRELVPQLMGPELSAVQFSERHVEVLGAAMRLIAERGVSRASLRELARRVGMSQPSLYHYFDSKEQLVEQIVHWYAADRIYRLPEGQPTVVRTLDELLAVVVERVLAIYHTDDHVAFVRFMFAATSERPQLRRLLRELVLDRAPRFLATFAQVFADRGDVLPAELPWVIKLVTNAMILHMLDHRVLAADSPGPDAHREYAAFVVDTVLRGARERARKAKEGKA